MLKKIKSYMMPIAMTIGVVFYQYVEKLSFITPYLIGLMLFFTYCNIVFSKIRFSKFHFMLIAFQLIVSWLVYLLLYPLNAILAQGAMICFLMPTATAAPVIAEMLGGNIESLTAYSLLCNMVIAVVAPINFALVGDVDASSFLHSVISIAERVFVLLLAPFILAYLIYRFLPIWHAKIKKLKVVSFYLWTIALIVTTGRIIIFIKQQDSDQYYLEIGLAIIALFACLTQFVVGRAIGRRYGDTVSGGQGLGQKNTILAIWMAQVFLNPISSIAPGAYVLWQNIVNSYQIWLMGRKK